MAANIIKGFFFASSLYKMPSRDFLANEQSNINIVFWPEYFFDRSRSKDALVGIGFSRFGGNILPFAIDDNCDALNEDIIVAWDERILRVCGIVGSNT